MSTVLDQGNRTFIGSVLFLDIVGYTKKSVAAQIAMKERFTSLLSASLKDIAADQRIILDTGDGAAITFLGDPEDALFVAMQLRDALRQHEGDANLENDDPAGPVDVPIRTGINLGPVKLVRDINGQPNIVGDGINVAQRIMSFAPTRQIVVSRSFYDMVSVISEEYSKLFTYEGSRTDKHVRDHEIYVVGESAAAFKQAKDGMTDRAAITNSRAKALKIDALAATPGTETAAPSVAATSQAQERKKLFLIGGVLAAVVVALAVALIVKTGGDKAVTTAAANSAAAPAASAAPATPSATTAPAPDPGAKAPMAAPAAAKAEPKPSAPPPEVPGVLTFGIQPWGEIFINGKSIGVSPPLKQTKLAPGQYSVEVRNTSFPTFTMRVDIKPKETRNIAHKF